MRLRLRVPKQATDDSLCPEVKGGTNRANARMAMDCRDLGQSSQRVASLPAFTLRMNQPEAICRDLSKRELFRLSLVLTSGVIYGEDH